MTQTAPRWEKMSKSKNNGISVDEVVYGVAEIDRGYCFIDRQDNVVNHRTTPIYRNQNDGFYYTHHNRGHLPVFLVSIYDKSVLPDVVWKDGIVNQFERWESLSD